MPPLAAADALLILEFIAGNHRVPNAVFAALVASLPSSSASTRTSPRLRKALVLRALDGALHDAEGASTSCSFALLREARRVLADPGAAVCFPYQLPLADEEEDDEARAAAAVADLKRVLDHEWANLPPSTLELAAERIAGRGALQTWAAADHAKRTKLRLLVGESTEREILAKLERDESARHPPIPQDVPDNTRDASETDHTPRGNEADPSRENNEANRAQEDRAPHQDNLAKGAPAAQHPDNSVARGIVTGKAHSHSTPHVMDKATISHIIGRSGPRNANGRDRPAAASKQSLMERNPNATTYEWDGSGDSYDDNTVGKRQLPPFERKPKLPPASAHKSRKKWSEIEEKTLLEGVEKYGKGNWKDIKVAYPDVFKDRSTVHLKDKFRNMERHQWA